MKLLPVVDDSVDPTSPEDTLLVLLVGVVFTSSVAGVAACFSGVMCLGRADAGEDGVETSSFFLRPLFLGVFFSADSSADSLLEEAADCSSSAAADEPDLPALLGVGLSVAEVLRGRPFFGVSDLGVSTDDTEALLDLLTLLGVSGLGLSLTGSGSTTVLDDLLDLLDLRTGV